MQIELKTLKNTESRIEDYLYLIDLHKTLKIMGRKQKWWRLMVYYWERWLKAIWQFLDDLCGQVGD